MTKVLVTGATGFVGYHITKQLAEPAPAGQPRNLRGQRVRVLVRRPERAKILEPFGVELSTGDVTDPASVRAAMEGVETVFHTAAWVGFWRTGSGRMDAVNVEGTRNVLMAAREAGVKHFLHVSSVAAVGQSLDGQPADENNPWLAEWEEVNYVRTKRRAEELVLRFARENPGSSRTVGIHPVHGEPVPGEPDMHAGLEARHSSPMKVVAVNPTIILGAPDHYVSGGGRMVLNFLQGKVPGTIHWVGSFVDVRDVAAAAIRAITRGRSGERYILSAAAMPLPQFYAMVAEIAGMKPPRFRLPRWFAYTFALLEEMRGAITRRSPAITREMLRHTTHPACYSSAKARRELGFSPRPLRETIADTVQWFQGSSGGL